MKLPDGVVGLRKVRTVFGREHGRTHLTWVLAYNAGIEIGSPRYEAIRAFAGGLRAPRKAGVAMEQSVMFLPVAPPDTSQAPPPSAAGPPRKPRARPKKRRPQPAAKPAAKRMAKTRAKTPASTRAKPAASRASKTRKPARRR